MVTFLGAITLLCFFETRNLSQRIITSVAWLVLLVVFIWVIQHNWKSGGNDPQSSSYDDEKPQLQLSDENNRKRGLKYGRYSESTTEMQKGGRSKFPDLKMYRGLVSRSQNSIQSTSSSKSASLRNVSGMVWFFIKVVFQRHLSCVLPLLYWFALRNDSDWSCSDNQCWFVLTVVSSQAQVSCERYLYLSSLLSDIPVVR